METLKCVLLYSSALTCKHEPRFFGAAIMKSPGGSLLSTAKCQINTDKNLLKINVSGNEKEAAEHTRAETSRTLAVCLYKHVTWPNHKSILPN